MKLIFENWKKFLDEAKEDDVREKYKNELDGESWRYLLKWIAENRSQRLKFLNWAAKLLVAAGKPGIKDGPLTFPDAIKQREFTKKELIPALQLFADNSQQLKNRSIDAYKTPADIKKAYYQDVQMKRVSRARKARGKYKGIATKEEHSVLIHTDDHLFVVRPLTTLGSCFFGSQTKWCISQEDNEYFERYIEREGKGFYFIKDDRLKENHKFSKVALQLSNEVDLNYPCEGGVSALETGKKPTDDDFSIAFGFKPSVCFQGWWDRYDNPDIQRPYPMKDLLQHFSKEELIPILKKAQADFGANPAAMSENAVRKFVASIPSTYSAGGLGFEATLEWGADQSLPTITLFSRIVLKPDLPFLENYEDEETRDSYVFKAEGDIKDAISEMPMPHKYDGEPPKIWFYPVKKYVKVLVHLEFDGKSKYNNITQIKNAIGKIKETYSKEEVAKIKNKVAEIFEEKMMPYLDPEHLEAFNKEKAYIPFMNYEYFRPEYDEHDDIIHYEAKSQTSLKIPPTNREGEKGNAADSSFRLTVETFLTKSFDKIYKDAIADVYADQQGGVGYPFEFPEDMRITGDIPYAQEEGAGIPENTMAVANFELSYEPHTEKKEFEKIKKTIKFIEDNLEAINKKAQESFPALEKEIAKIFEENDEKYKKENDEKYKKATRKLSLARKKKLQEGKRRIKVYIK
jgi:hypothetical protein